MTSSEPLKARPAGLGRGLSAALIALGVIGAAAVLYVIVVAVAKPGASAGLAGLASGTMAHLQVIEPATPATDVSFTDAIGKTVHLAGFKGRPLLVNLWATWCPPCVREMGTLAALQRAEGGKVEVVAISVDSDTDTAKAKAFLAGYPPLVFHQDAKYAFLADFDPHPMGFPTTYLIDRHGQLRGVYAGEADWNSPQAKAVADRLAGL
jgi:thiol-disulfide isomerase/thioredoxin